jgi:hypothetical protein
MTECDHMKKYKARERRSWMSPLARLMVQREMWMAVGRSIKVPNRIRANLSLDEGFHFVMVTAAVELSACSSSCSAAERFYRASPDRSGL